MPVGVGGGWEAGGNTLGKKKKQGLEWVGFFNGGCLRLSHVGWQAGFTMKSS